MMKSIITFLLVICWVMPCTAQIKHQNAEVTFGDLNYMTRMDFNILGYIRAENGYLILKKKTVIGPGGFNYFIEKLDDNLKLIRSTDVTTCFEDNEKIAFDRFVNIGPNYYMFTTRFFPKEERREIDYYYVSGSTGAIGEKELLMDQKSNRQKNYSIVLSEDDENLLLTTFSSATQKVESELKLRIFDQNMSEVWNYESAALANDYPNYVIRRAKLSNDGHVYLLGWGGYIVDEDSTHLPLFTTINANDDSEHIMPLVSGEDKFIDGWSPLEIHIDKDGKLYVYGYYSDEEKDESLVEKYISNGVFRFLLDPDSGGVISEIYDEFSEEVLPDQSVERNRSRENAYQEIHYGISIEHVAEFKFVEHSDGSVSMLGYNSLVYRSPDFPIVIPHDLIVSHISTSGEMIHTRHNGMKRDYILELNNGIFIPLVQRMSQVDTRGLTEKDKKKLKQTAYTVVIIDEEGELKTEYVVDYANPNYDKPFTILWNERKMVFEEDDFTDIFMKTHFGKSKYGWVRIRFLEE